MKMLFVIALLGWVACGDNTEDDPCNVDFDQSAMFQHYTNQLIVPAYTALKEKVDIMSNDATAFTSNPNITTLAAFRSSFLEAYAQWQYASGYNFGPAEEVFLTNSLNNFPLDTAALQSNIESGNYDFTSPDDFDKGFPALDYLLYGTGHDESGVVAAYLDNSAMAANRLEYLNSLVADIEMRVNHVYNAWTTGDYANTFNTNTGTAAGTSLSLLVNYFNENYENLKRNKIGIPSGALTLGFTNPTKVEAFYSGQSFMLAQHALDAAEDMYLGKANDADGLGLDDYLKAINSQDAQPLHESITTQFGNARNALNQLNDPLSDAADNQNAAFVTAYNELSKLVVDIKTNMPSLMCIAITYVDNPSDSD